MISFIVCLVVMELHPVFVKGFAGLSYPAKGDLYSDGPYKIWRNISNRIDIPENFFEDVKGKKSACFTEVITPCLLIAETVFLGRPTR